MKIAFRFDLEVPTRSERMNQFTRGKVCHITMTLSALKLWLAVKAEESQEDEAEGNEGQQGEGEEH